MSWSYHLRLFCAWTGVAELSRRTPPPENPHHVLKQQRAASSFSCWGLFFMAWVIGYILLALILRCIISCTFFSFFFKQQCYLKLLSLEYQLLSAVASSSELQTFSFESVLSFCFCFLMGKCWRVTPACRDTPWLIGTALPFCSKCVIHSHTIFSIYSGLRFVNAAVSLNQHQ